MVICKSPATDGSVHQNCLRGFEFTNGKLYHGVNGHSQRTRLLLKFICFHDFTAFVVTFANVWQLIRKKDWGFDIHYPSLRSRTTFYSFSVFFPLPPHKIITLGTLSSQDGKNKEHFDKKINEMKFLSRPCCRRRRGCFRLYSAN